MKLEFENYTGEELIKHIPNIPTMDKNEFENIFYKIENFTIVKQALLAFRAIGGIVEHIFKYNKVPEYAVKHFNINNKNLYCMTYVGYHHTLVGLCQKLWNEEL